MRKLKQGRYACRRTKGHGQSGAALVTALILMFTMFAGSSLLGERSLVSLKNTNRHNGRMAASYLAQSGIEQGRMYLSTVGSFQDALTAGGLDPVTLSTGGTFLVDVTDNVDGDNDPAVDSDGILIVTSTGTAATGDYSGVLQMAAQETNTLGVVDFAMLSGGTIEFTDSAAITTDGTGADIHANGEVTYSGATISTENAPTTGATGLATIPPANAALFMERSDFVLRADGSVWNNATQSEAKGGGAGEWTGRGWAFIQPEIGNAYWEYNEHPLANDNTDAGISFFSETETHINTRIGDVLSEEKPKFGVASQGDVTLDGEAEIYIESPDNYKGVSVISDTNTTFDNGSSINAKGSFVTGGGFRQEAASAMTLNGRLVATGDGPDNTSIFEGTVAITSDRLTPLVYNESYGEYTARELYWQSGNNDKAANSGANSVSKRDTTVIDGDIDDVCAENPNLVACGGGNVIGKVDSAIS